MKVETKASADHALDLYASMQEVRLRDCPDPVREINTQIRKLRKRGWTIEPPTEE